MTIYALVPEHTPYRLWGLSSVQRLKRQISEIARQERSELRHITWLSGTAQAPETGQVLILNGSFLFEVRTLKGVLDHPNHVLKHPDNTIAAAFVDAKYVDEVLRALEAPAHAPESNLATLKTGDMEAFDESLRRSTAPLLERVSDDNKRALENHLYGNAYRGITDLVTKFLWPRPAKRAVHVCASLHLSPNMVTSIGLLLVVAACYLFLNGEYGWGLLAGWLMTFLDTVDGKLARVTIQSSKFGHLYDHAIDLFHPPFWYIYWGMSLTGFQGAFGLDQPQMYWTIIIAYVAGRVVEGIFPLLGRCSIFTWRPFDAWFRLVTARRNPCLIILTSCALIGKPAWGFIGVTAWSALTTVILVLRLIQAIAVRMMNGPLESWLSEDDVATGPHAASYAVFGATRGAYAG